MIFGFNTDVVGKDAVYHVQTEDRGKKNPVIDSIIYIKGKIVDRRRTPYVPAEVTTAQIEELVRQQHRELVEAIRAGTFTPSGTASPQSVAPVSGYAIRLLNPTDLIRGSNLQFEFSLARKGKDSPATDVSVEARWVIAGALTETGAPQTQQDGGVVVSFPVPAQPTEAILLLRIRGPHGQEFAKFRVCASRA